MCHISQLVSDCVTSQVESNWICTFFFGTCLVIVLVYLWVRVLVRVGLVCVSKSFNCVIIIIVVVSWIILFKLVKTNYITF
ncbi:hypothetical protein ACSBR2_026974 [Camellia fascicularis]